MLASCLLLFTACHTRYAYRSTVRVHHTGAVTQKHTCSLSEETPADTVLEGSQETTYRNLIPVSPHIKHAGIAIGSTKALKYLEIKETGNRIIVSDDKEKHQAPPKKKKDYTARRLGRWGTISMLVGLAIIGIAAATLPGESFIPPAMLGFLLIILGIGLLLAGLIYLGVTEGTPYYS
jgi:hypothetical protein